MNRLPLSVALLVSAGKVRWCKRTQTLPTPLQTKMFLYILPAHCYKGQHTSYFFVEIAGRQVEWLKIIRPHELEYGTYFKWGHGQVDRHVYTVHQDRIETPLVKPRVAYREYWYNVS